MKRWNHENVKTWRTDFCCQGTWFDLANSEHVHFELEVVGEKVQIFVQNFQKIFSTISVRFFYFFFRLLHGPDIRSKFSIQVFGPDFYSNFRSRSSSRFLVKIFRSSVTVQIFGPNFWAQLFVIDSRSSFRFSFRAGLSV